MVNSSSLSGNRDDRPLKVSSLESDFVQSSEESLSFGPVTSTVNDVANSVWTSQQAESTTQQTERKGSSPKVLAVERLPANEPAKPSKWMTLAYLIIRCFLPLLFYVSFKDRDKVVKLTPQETLYDFRPLDPKVTDDTEVTFHGKMEKVPETAYKDLKRLTDSYRERVRFSTGVEKELERPANEEARPKELFGLKEVLEREMGKVIKKASPEAQRAYNNQKDRYYLTSKENWFHNYLRLTSHESFASLPEKHQHKITSLLQKDGEIYIDPTGVTQRVHLILKNENGEFVVGKLERHFSLEFFCSSWDDLTEADLANCSQTVTFSPPFKNQEAAIAEFEKRIGQREKSTASSSSLKLWDKIKKEKLPGAFQQLKEIASEGIKLPKEGEKHDLRMRFMLKDPQNANGPKEDELAKPTSNNESIWAPIRLEQMASWVGNDPAWASALKKATASNPYVHILSEIMTKRMLLSDQERLNTAQLFQGSEAPSVQFTINRDKEGQITSIDVFSEAQIHLLDKQGRTIVSPLMTAKYHGKLVKKEDGFVGFDNPTNTFNIDIRSSHVPLRMRVKPVKANTTTAVAQESLRQVQLETKRFAAREREVKDGAAQVNASPKVTKRAPSKRSFTIIPPQKKPLFGLFNRRAKTAKVAPAATPLPTLPTAEETAKKVSNLAPNVDIVNPRVIYNNLNAVPTQKVELETKAGSERETKAGSEKLVPIEHEGTKLYVPRSVLDDFRRNLNGLKQYPGSKTFSVSIGNTTLSPFPKDPNESPETALITFYKELLANVPSLAKLENSDKEVSTWFNKLMFAVNQSAFSESSTKFFNQFSGMAQISAPDKVEGHPEIPTRNINITFDAQGQVNIKMTYLFNIQGPGIDQDKYFFWQTLERSFPEEMLGNTVDANLLEKTTYHVHNSATLNSLEQVQAEMRTRLDPNYKIPQDLLNAAREVERKEKRAKEDTENAQAKKFAFQALPEIRMGAENEIKRIQDELPKIIKDKFNAGKNQQIVPSFDKDASRMGFVIVDTDVHIHNRSAAADAATNIANLLKEKNKAWNKPLQALINQELLSNLMTNLMGELQNKLIEAGQLSFSGGVQPSIYLKLNRDPNGNLRSVDFEVDASVDILKRGSQEPLVESAIKGNIKGRMTLNSKGEPQIGNLKVVYTWADQTPQK